MREAFLQRRAADAAFYSKRSGGTNRPGVAPNDPVRSGGKAARRHGLHEQAVHTALRSDRTTASGSWAMTDSRTRTDLSMPKRSCSQPSTVRGSVVAAEVQEAIQQKG